MKSLLAAANKSLIEIRQQNLDKNEEIVKQKELIATLTESKNKLEQSTKEIKGIYNKFYQKKKKNKIK